MPRGQKGGNPTGREGVSWMHAKVFGAVCKAPRQVLRDIIPFIPVKIHFILTVSEIVASRCLMATMLKRIILITLFVSAGAIAQSPVADHHQHVFSPSIAEVQKIRSITAADVIKDLDE